MTNCFSIKKTLNFDFNLGLDHKKNDIQKEKNMLEEREFSI
jgi:hypothetical protein